MRVSADRKDKDYFLLIFERYVRVLLDGVEVKGVIEADDEAGYVIHHPRGADGKLIRTHDRKSLVIDRLEGRVEFIGQLRPKRFS